MSYAFAAFFSSILSTTVTAIATYIPFVVEAITKIKI